MSDEQLAAGDDVYGVDAGTYIDPMAPLADPERGHLLSGAEARELLGIEPLREEEDVPRLAETIYPDSPKWVDADRVMHRRLRAIAGHDHAYIYVRLPVNGGEGKVDFSEELAVEMLPAIFGVLALGTSR